MMEVVETVKPSTLRDLRKHFKNKGTIKACAEKTGLHRNTISRLMNLGRATESVINKVMEYYQAKNYSC